MKKIRMLSFILALAMLAGSISFSVFAADVGIKTLEDYPEVAYAMDANDKKSIENAGLKVSTTNTNENKYSGKWAFEETGILRTNAVTDVNAYETIEFYVLGDEKHTATLIFTLWADDPNTEGSDYYSAGEFEVKPGWNKYSFSISEMKESVIRSPLPLTNISNITIWASGWDLDQRNSKDTVLYFDSIKLIRGEKLIDEPYVPEPEGEAGTAKYFEYNFEQSSRDEINTISFVPKSNKIDLEKSKDKKEQYLKLMSLGTNDDCYIDIPVKYTGRYLVMSADFMTNGQGNGSQLFAVKDSTNAQNHYVLLRPDGSLTANGIKIGAMEPGKWTNIAVCTDIVNHTYDVYIDGKLVADDTDMSNKNLGSIIIYRLFLSPVPGGEGDICVDNLMMFDGKSPDDYEKAVDKPAASSGIKIDVNSDVIPAYKQVKSNAVAEVKDAVCLKVNSPFALVRHEQKAIDENNSDVAPFIINGRTLVPVRFISEAFGAEVGWNDAARMVTIKKDSDIITLAIGSDILNKNGTDITIDVPAEIYNDRTMLPLRAVTENLGKKVFWDDMGLIIISDNEINFTKEKDLDKMLDIMAGFIYERPGREKIAEDIKATTPNHPRLLATASDFARIRELLKTDAYIQQWVASKQNLVDTYVASAKAGTEVKPVYSSDAGGRLTSNYSVPTKAYYLGLFYQLTGEKKYADAMWYTLEDMCNRDKWEHWHPGHFLDAAGIMQGVAIAYDWMYDAWTPEQRTIIEEALYDCGIEDSITAYYGATDYLSPPMGEWHRSGWWAQENNWNAASNAGMMAAGIVMATHEKYGDLAVKAIDFALNGFEVGLRCYAPDGGYEEGPHYWAYGTGNAIMIMEYLKVAAGTNYGLSDAPGFSVTYATPLYSESKQGMFNYSDTNADRTDTSSLFWFGREYGNAQVNGIRFNELASGEKNSTYLDILWYDPDNTDMSSSLVSEYKFHTTATFTMRSSWTDSNQIFVGVHGGNNAANHANIDSGTFVLDALNTRWFIDLGPDNYNLPNYWSTGTGGKRWQYYTQRAEGHNTFVINPGLEEDQVIKSVSPVTELVSKPRGAYGKLDLTPAYSKDAVSAIRGSMLAANRKAVIIQDEIKMKAPSEFYWFAHTRADISVSEDGRSAVLTMGAKKLHAAIVSDNADFKFGVMDAVSLPSSPTAATSAVQKEVSREGVRKLVIHGSDVSEVNLAVVFQPMLGDFPEYSYTYTALDSWTVPDGEILVPKAESIAIGGNAIENFNRDITDYKTVLPYGTTQVPEITATADAQSTCQVTLPDSLPGTATVKVTNKEDSTMYTVYNVFLRAANEIELELSGEQEGNGGENCMDGDLSTRWAVEGKSWGIFNFANPRTISSVWLAAWKSAERKLIFDIEVSTDGVNFTRVFSGMTSINEDVLEEFKIPQGTYKAVKIVMHGTTTGTWNSLLEVEFK